MKFEISYSEVVHYLTKTVEADSIDEAREKFYDMFDEGDVEPNETEELYMKIRDEQGRLLYDERADV